MEVGAGRRRTGGRSARVRAAVHRSVTELLAEQGAGNVTIAEVAARSGVHPTSIYRRWGTVEALVLDVAAARVEAESSIPDTGALRVDLLTYARQASHDVARPDGLAFLRAVVATADGAGGGDAAVPFLQARGAQIQVMLDRATDRGEQALHYTDVLDGILAPIYLRVLFGVGGTDDAHLALLVDRLLTVPVPLGSPRRVRPDRRWDADTAR